MSCCFNCHFYCLLLLLFFRLFSDFNCLSSFFEDENFSEHLHFTYILLSGRVLRFWEGQPIGMPSSQPSAQPSTQPTSQPASQPTMQPTMQPTSQPTFQPSSQPSGQPSSKPIRTNPSSRPSSQPSNVIQIQNTFTVLQV